VTAAAAVLVALSLAAQSAERTTIVAGRVIDASTGRAVAGAVLWTAGSAVAEPGASGRVRVITNAAGRFVFRGVKPGVLVLTAIKAGYVNATTGQRRAGGTGQPLHVDADHRLEDVEIRMWRFAAIGGTIVDEYGDPAVSVRVEALRRTFAAGRARFDDATSAVTDDRGVYRIGGLTPGEYVVRVPSTQTSVPSELMDAFFGGAALPETQRAQVSREMKAIGSVIAPPGSGHAMRAGNETWSMPPGSLTPAATATGTVVYPTAYFPAAASLAQASVIALGSGDERTGADMQLRPVRGVSISGTVLGPSGGVPITAVRLLPAQDEGTSTALSVATTMTDWTGGFTFPAVPPGQYTLHVVRIPQPEPDVDGTPRVSTAPGGHMTIASNAPSAPAAPPPVPADATLAAQVPLSIGDSAVDDLIVPLTPAARVSGRIQFRGTREPPTPQTIAGMRIVVTPADGSGVVGPDEVRNGVHANEDGSFRTYGYPPGRYLLDVIPLSSRSGWYLETAIFEGQDITDRPVDLATKDLDGVAITFTDRPSAIGGTVTGTRGGGAALVLAFPADDTSWTGASRRIRGVRASEDGTFVIEALPPGDYSVAAVQDDLVGEWNDPALLRALAAVARTVHVLEGERSDVSLRAASITIK
jgi:protocatechuate 3,4-dioxygenase beta subunit